MVRSYPRDFIKVGSKLRSSILSTAGAVNGWCLAKYRFESSSNSNIGKSVIHIGLYLFWSINSIFFATSTLRAPNTFKTMLSLSPIIKIISSSLIFVDKMSSFWSLSERNFDIPPSNFPSLAFIHAKPFALTNSVYSSIIFLENEAPLGTTIAFTLSTDLNALNSDWSVIDFISWRKISNRVSGLSEPYWCIASVHVNLGNESGRSISFTLLNTWQVRLSISL